MKYNKQLSQLSSVNSTSGYGITGYLPTMPDIFAGFVVFLFALPLSLGIAKASEFPPIMGLMTAIIGGVLGGLLSGSKLAIKGPAAGLIVIVAGAVNAFGGGEQGWHLALGAIVVAGIIQVLFGLLNFGRLVSFFPLSAVHGMLAAIGLTIIAKQIPVLLNVDPHLVKGKPFDLFLHVPEFIQHLDPLAASIGFMSLVIMMAWPKLKYTWAKKIPAPLMVLVWAIPASLLLNLHSSSPSYTLVHIGSLLDQFGIQVAFSTTVSWLDFTKYVVMFALVGSLESLLTVKAVDMLDRNKNKSNPNKDLIAIGVGNIIAGCFGGLPMISEVARSTANVNQGAKSQWSNIIHGLLVFLFAVFAVQALELIPNSALAAMLITVGVKLAHPHEFLAMLKTGKEQLLIFVVTIVVTLSEDLLMGIGAGIIVKLFIHLLHGAPFKSLFKAIIITESDNVTEHRVVVKSALIFSNYLQLLEVLQNLPKGGKIWVDLSETRLIDHSVMAGLEEFKMDYSNTGGELVITGLASHMKFSQHPFAARKKLENWRFSVAD